MQYFVYLLECSDKNIYTGITTDLTRRLKEHKAGVGSHYTRSHGAEKILYSERYKTRGGNKTMAEREEIKTYYFITLTLHSLPACSGSMRE